MEIRISDKRSGRFIVDNCILDEYGGRLGSTGIALYVAICRYASNQTQECWPSLDTLHAVTGMKRNTIVDAGKLLVDLRLISKEVVPGRYVIYTLLEPTSTEKGTSIQKVQGGSTEKGTATSTEKGTQTNVLNERKNEHKDQYSKKLERNENGLPVFADVS